MKKLILLFIFLTFGMIFISLVSAANWGDGDWGFKKEITITGSVQNNDSVRLIVEKESSMQADFDDLRIIDTTETAELKYWIVNYTATNATVYAKITNDNPIYLYYGNDGASTTSDRTQIEQVSNLHTGTGSGWGTTTGTYRGGQNATVINDTDITFIRKLGGDTATSSYLLNTDKSIRVNLSDFVDDYANISYPYRVGAGDDFVVAVDKKGASYTYNYSGLGYSYPYSDGGTIVWDISLDSGGSNDWYAGIMNIHSVGTIQVTNATVSFGAEQPLTEATITLVSPASNDTFSDPAINFSVNVSSTDFNFTNVTYYVWKNTTLFNSSVEEISGNANQTNFSISGFILGSFKWNAYVCYGNASYSNCSFAAANNTFDVGLTLLSNVYNSLTYESALETFIVQVKILPDSEISLAQLIYNGINYSISNISQAGNTLTLTRSIDVPINSGPFSTGYNNFSYSFAYTDAESSTQTLGPYYQNASFINLQLCNTTYNSSAINFTLFDELTGEWINATDNNTNFEAYFNYWLGSGSVYRNYSYSLLENNETSNYSFCIYPVNRTFHVDLNSIYSADGYSERGYNFQNASLTNDTSITPLYLLNDDEAVKFTVTVKQGVNNLDNALVTVSKFFTGEGIYKTTSIKETDSLGQFVDYLHLDRDYMFSVVYNGELLGVLYKTATCSASPCELTLQIDDSAATVWEAYSDLYAVNILSNLSFNQTDKILTYTFIDITGLASYFRLEVSKAYLNESTEVICNSYSYSSSGTLTCNLTGYDGDFIAKTYISRSPEKLDKVLQFVISEIKDSLGLLAIFFSIIVILTLVMAGAAMSQGNPSVMIFMFGVAVLALKLMQFFPFSWGIIGLIELFVLLIMVKLGT